jgi:hypothetical protein
MILYHGSNVKIINIDYQKHVRTKTLGVGFI